MRVGRPGRASIIPVPAAWSRKWALKSGTLSGCATRGQQVETPAEEFRRSGQRHVSMVLSLKMADTGTRLDGQ